MACRPLPYSGGTTDTAAGLRAMLAEFQANGRTGVNWIGVVVQDGQSVNATATWQQAALCRQAGITLLVVAVTNVRLLFMFGWSLVPRLNYRLMKLYFLCLKKN